MSSTSNYRPIPIAAARRLAMEFSKDQVIIVTWDAAHGMMHVTTYGRTAEDCRQAARGGDFVKRALGFETDAPEAHCAESETDGEGTVGPRGSKSSPR